MAGVFLALFPILLMVNTRLAVVALVAAVVTLYVKRVDTAKREARRRVYDEI